MKELLGTECYQEMESRDGQTRKEQLRSKDYQECAVIEGKPKKSNSVLKV